MNRCLHLLAGTAVVLAVLLITACASGPAPKEPLPDSFSVGDVMLESDVAEARQTVRELCNTGEGSADLDQAWIDYGYEKTTGKSFIDAFTYVSDLEYSDDPKAIVNDGTFTYPTIASLADNCLDATYLVSQPVTDIRFPETASVVLEEFHTGQGSDEVLALERISQLNTGAN